jgi:hypothetical protein
MATLILNAYTAERNGAFISMALCIGGEPPFPRRAVEIKNVADCVAAFEAYKNDAAASGKPLALSMMMGRGDRKPPGFNKLKAAASYETVNL